MSHHSNPLPPWLTETYMENILRAPLKSAQLKVLHLDASPGSSVGDNYCCQIWRIKLHLDADGKERDLSIIAKVTPETKLLDSIKEKFDVFDIEASLFAKTLPAMKKHLQKGGDFAPECYYVDLEKKVIFMEDLKALHYELQPRGVFLTRDHCKLVMEALGAWHGLSYKAIQDDPTLPSQYQATFWDGELCDMNEKFFSNAQRAIEKNISTYGLTEEQSKKLLGFYEKVQNGGLKVIKRKEEGLNFLLHGDCWMNNMLFHFKNGVPDAIKLLDFQIVYYSCFANDLHYFLFSSAEADVILNDLDFLLETYFMKLQEVAPEITKLSLERVKAEFEERYYFGFLLAVSFRAFMVSETPPDIEKIIEGKLVDMGFSTERYASDLKKMLKFFEKVGVF